MPIGVSLATYMFDNRPDGNALLRSEDACWRVGCFGTGISTMSQTRCLSRRSSNRVPETVVHRFCFTHSLLHSLKHIRQLFTVFRCCHAADALNILQMLRCQVSQRLNRRKRGLELAAFVKKQLVYLLFLNRWPRLFVT